VSLKSINGVGTVLALTILHETDTWERFPTVQDYISYCRLIPGTSSSAGKLLGFKGGKLGNPYLKWAYKEAAMLCKRNHPDLRAYGQRLENKHGTKKANAILASKLARSVYHMLQDHSVFDPKKFVGKN
jgi:transposase